jgi:hypothetical protein
MKTHREVEVNLQAFLTLDVEGQLHTPAALPPGEKKPSPRVLNRLGDGGSWGKSNPDHSARNHSTYIYPGSNYGMLHWLNII